MEDYNLQLREHANSKKSRSKGNFMYGHGCPIIGPGSSGYGRTRGAGAGGCFQLHPSSCVSECYDRYQGPILRSDGGSTSQSINRGGPNSKSSFHHHRDGQPVIRGHFQGHSRENERPEEVDAMKAKIIAHPHYSNLLEAYIDCQKVGAPPEVVARMAEVRHEFDAKQRATAASGDFKDPELDQFMEAYYDMLVKYREELTRPLQEAMEFLRRIETQLNNNMLTKAPLRILNSEDKCEGVVSSEEEQDNMSSGEMGEPKIDPRAEDCELKKHLLKKYSGNLSSLKQELSKKKKKGKLPKDARQKLLSWWELHYKWPYPSESEKAALAELTGLDQKQINNWFINQRKRHWKPSEDMQLMVMEGFHPQTAALYMESHYMGDGPYRLGP